MLTMRQEQVDAFQQNTLQKFEDEMVEHLGGFAPRLCRILRTPAIREIVQVGIRRASRYQFDQRGSVRLYLELMFSFGTYFDSDPQLPWASLVLADQSIGDPMLRAELLYRAMLRYSHRVVGPNNRYAIYAMKQLQLSRWEHLQGIPGDLESRIVRGFGVIYPQKAEYVGEPVLRDLARSAINHSKALGAESELSYASIAGLMFSLGHGILNDSLYPWVAATLSQQLVPDVDRRVQRLYKKTLTYIDHTLGHLDTVRVDA